MNINTQRWVCREKERKRKRNRKRIKNYKSTKKGLSRACDEFLCVTT